MTKTLPKTLTGHCACGNITVSARPSELWAGYCHCQSCRKATGAPVSAYVGLKVKDVTLQGSPKKFATSEGVSRAWCERCGTPVSYESVRWPDEIHFHISLFDYPEQFELEGHTYTDERLPWFDIADDLPRSKKPTN